MTVTRPVLTPEEKKELLKARARKLKRLKELKTRKLRYEQEEEKYKIKIRKSEEANKVFYFGHEDKGYLGAKGKWEANKPQARLLKQFKNKDKKIFTFTGGNRSGKTFSGMILILSCMLGRFPWEPEDTPKWIWELRGWKPPTCST